MSTLTLRDIPEALMTELERQAKTSGVSVEEWTLQSLTETARARERLRRHREVTPADELMSGIPAEVVVDTVREIRGR